MKYENAKDILPDDLLREIQKYAQGKIIYVPTAVGRKPWGENSGYKNLLALRNDEIKRCFINGEGIEELAEKYFLSIESIKKIVYSKKERNNMSSFDCGETQKFEIPNERTSILEILVEACQAMKEKGYDPINQIVGYIVTGDPAYVTNHNNARSLISNIDRDDLLRMLVRNCLNR